MQLYILRHADAETVAASDDERPLSDKGRDQAKRAARFCKEHGIAPAIVLSSPLPRAAQTARPVADEAKAQLVVLPWLSSGMMPETAVEELKAYRTHGSVMIVGHEPDLSALAAHLLGIASNSQLHVRKGSLTALQVDVIRAGAARLEFSIPNRMM